MRNGNKGSENAARDVRSVVLERPQIYVVPTKQGILFGTVLLALLAGSINYNNSLGYAFTFLLGGMVMVSILHTYRNIAGLSLKAGRAPPTFAGGKAAFELLVTNCSLHPRCGVRLEVDGQHADIVDIMPRQTVPIVLSVRALRRGVMPLGRIAVTTRYPLGFFRGSSPVELSASCLVYPQPGLPGRSPLEVVYSPETEGVKGRGTGDFVGFREYAPGDSLRHIHWKAYARGQGMVTKQFGGGDSLEQWFDWEQLPGFSTEPRLSQLCRWILDAHRSEKRYGLRLPGTVIKVSSGARHKHRCLEALARF